MTGGQPSMGCGRIPRNCGADCRWPSGPGSWRWMPAGGSGRGIGWRRSRPPAYASCGRREQLSVRSGTVCCSDAAAERTAGTALRLTRVTWSTWRRWSIAPARRRTRTPGAIRSWTTCSRRVSRAAIRWGLDCVRISRVGSSTRAVSERAGLVTLGSPRRGSLCEIDRDPGDPMSGAEPRGVARRRRPGSSARAEPLQQELADRLGVGLTFVAFITVPTRGPTAATLPPRTFSAMSGCAAIASSTACGQRILVPDDGEPAGRDDLVRRALTGEHAVDHLAGQGVGQRAVGDQRDDPGHVGAGDRQRRGLDALLRGAARQVVEPPGRGPSAAGARRRCVSSTRSRTPAPRICSRSSGVKPNRSLQPGTALRAGSSGSASRICCDVVGAQRRAGAGRAPGSSGSRSPLPCCVRTR